MAEPRKHINYRLEDIEAYLKGRLSPAAMHELEKAALQDPFLADAIDGYRENDLAATRRDLRDIGKELTDQQEEKRTLPIIPSRRSAVWQYAAAILILAGTGGLGWFLMRESGKTNSLALQSTPAAAPRHVDSPTVSPAPKAEPTQQQKEIAASNPRGAKEKQEAGAESKKSNEQLADVSAAPANKSKEAIAKLDLARQSDRMRRYEYEQRNLAARNAPNAKTFQLRKDAGNNSLAKSYPASPTPQIQGEAAASAIKVADLLAKEKSANNFSGVVLDSSGQPVANATVQIGNTDRVTLTNEQGRFSFSNADSLTSVAVNALGYERTDLALKAGLPVAIKLHPGQESLSEVVVTGLSIKRKKDVTASATILQKSADSLTPRGGWDSFKNYLHKELDPGTGKTLTGDITIQLTLNKRGAVEHVYVIEAVQGVQHDTIIQLLRKGPRWMNASGKPATGVHRFTVHL